MRLSALIRKGGLTRSMTATPATPATHEANKPLTVAQVATVAVAAQPEPLLELSTHEEANIRAWLSHVEEADPAMIAEVVDKCRNNLEARRYVLQRSEEVPKTATDNRPMTCGGCIHFESINHPHLGRCAMGEPEAIAGLWDMDLRYCESFLSRPPKADKDQRNPVRPKQKGEFPK